MVVNDRGCVDGFDEFFHPPLVMDKRGGRLSKALVTKVARHNDFVSTR